MPEYSKERLRSLRIGISSYTEDELVLDIIGNTNISQDLHVGDISISSGIITSSNPGVSTVVYYGDGSNLFGVSAFSVIAQDSYNSPAYPTFANNTGVSSVGISTNNFVFIPSTGNLGLGTTNPTSKLHVVGVVSATSFVGDGYNLTRTKQSYQQNNTLVGSATTLNFIGAGVSSVTLTNDVVTVNIPNTVKTISSYNATEGQTIFSATYNLGLVDVYLNGSKLSQSDYTATDGLTVVLAEGAALNDLVEIIGYVTYKVVGTQTILVDTLTSSSGIITSYTGIADQGSSQSANVWTIRRSIFTPAGITSSTSSAVNVAWLNRYIVTYI